MKKIISLLLCLTLMLTLAVPCFAAGEEHPTIYITGAQTNDLYNADGERIYPLSDDLDAMQIIKDALRPCLEKLVQGFVTNDYEAYAREFYNVFVPIYEDIALDKNGEVSDGSHPKHTIYNCSIPKKTSNYGVWDYRFWYDWRISPMIAADELKEYIDMVIAATGEDKVNLTGRCYGANVIAAYLAKYEDHAVNYVDDVAYLSSSILGIDMLSALFSGEMKFEDQAINNFLNYFMNEENLVEDEAVNLFILTLVELFNQVKVLGITGEALEMLVDKVKYDLIPLILRDTFGSMPSYWSMVTPELYEQSIEFVFGDCKDEYAKLIEKADDYYNNVQLTAKEDMLKLKEKGIDFHIFVKYDFPDYPIYEGATAQGDGTTSAVRQGFGGTYADFGEVLSEKYIASIEDDTYLSPDRKIDASSCLFPENTWFVKGMHHDIFPDVINKFAMDIMNREISVSDGVFKQYQAYESNTLTPVEGLDEDGTRAPDNVFSSLIRFITSLLNILTKLFNGELTFDVEGMSN